MTKRIAKLKRSALRNIFAAFSFTTALFVFQACYGTPQGFEFGMLVEGTVKSETTGAPIRDIQLTIDDTYHVYTDTSGTFLFNIDLREQLTIAFADIDSELNGSYAPKDTIITIPQDSTHISLDIVLNEL